MADYQSIQMLAFNFASRTFAYERLAQGLSRSLSAFSSFIREYLDPVIKADQCAQYVDDIGIAANDATQLTTNISCSVQKDQGIRTETVNVQVPLRSETSRLFGTYYYTSRNNSADTENKEVPFKDQVSED